jgi:TP901 family phage tail tape measure protein
MDLATASDMVTDSMSALGIEATQTNLTAFADGMAVTAQKSNTSVQQLGEAILTVGGTAKNLAGGTTELNAALGVLANRGTKGAEGGTALRNILLSLQSPTDDAAKALNNLGAQVYDAQGNMRGINDIFKDLKKGMAGMSASQQDSIISTLFNKTDLADARSMLEGCGEEFDNLVANIDNSAGACEAMYKTMLDNIDGDIAIFQSSLSALGTSIYEAIQEPLRGIIQNVTDFITKLKSAFDEGGLRGMIQALGPVAIGVAAALGAVATAVTGIATAWKAYQTCAKITEVVQWALDKALFGCPIFWIIAAIAALIAIIAVCIVYWDKIKEAAVKAWEGIKGAWAAAVDFFKGLWDSIKNAVSDTWNSVKEKVSSVWDAIKSTVSEKASAIKNAVSEKFSAVKSVIGTVMDSTRSIVSDKLNNIKDAYQEHGGGIKGVVAAAMQSVKEYYTAGYDAINQLTGGKLGQVVDSVKSKLAPMVNVVKEKLSGVKEAFGEAFTNALNFIKASYNEGALKPVVDKIVSVFGTVKAAIAEKFTGIKKVISEKISAVLNEVSSIAGNIADKFTAVKSAIAEKFNGIKEAVGSKLTAIGEAASGLKDKIADKFASVKDAVAEKFTSIKTTVQKALEPVITVVTTIVTGVQSVISNAVDSIRTRIQNTVESVKTTVSNIIEGIKQNFQNFFTSITQIFENIKAAVSGIFEGLKTIVSGAFQTIVGVFTLNMNTIKSGVQTVMSGITATIDGAKTAIINIWNAITSAASLAFNNIKTVVTNVVNAIKQVVQSIKDTFTNVFNSVKSTVTSVFNSIKTTISSVWNGIKSLIKAPHVVQTGTISIAGIDTPIPKLGIKWYAKGGIMTQPTMFGFNEGNAMIGGEAGAEAILPLNEFWKNLKDFIADSQVKPSPYTPEKDTSVYYNTTGTESNVYSPQFNLTISGSNDDRKLERKVRRWLREEMQEMIAGMARKTEPTQII